MQANGRRESIICYECIKDFCAYLIEDGGYVKKGDVINVKKGSMWKQDTTAGNNIMGTEVRLENLTGLEYLELSKKKLETYSKPIN